MNQRRALLSLIVVAAAFALVPLEAASREWKDINGWTIEAEPLEKGSDWVRFQRSDGKVFTFPLRQLSQLDREWVEAWQPPVGITVAPLKEGDRVTFQTSDNRRFTDAKVMAVQPQAIVVLISDGVYTIKRPDLPAEIVARMPDWGASFPLQGGEKFTPGAFARVELPAPTPDVVAPAEVEKAHDTQPQESQRRGKGMGAHSETPLSIDGNRKDQTSQNLERPARSPEADARVGVGGLLLFGLFAAIAFLVVVGATRVAKKRKWMAGIAAGFMLFVGFYLCCGLFVVQPIGAVPEGVTVLYWRIGTNHPFISSADGLLLNRVGSVSLFGRALALGKIADEIGGRRILSLPYSRRLYLLSTEGTEFEQRTLAIAPVQIVEWNVKTGTRSDSYVRVEWKFHLSNPAGVSQRGQLWLFGTDANGFQCYEALTEVITNVPAGGEVKKIESLSLTTAEFDRIARWAIQWKPL